MKNFEEFKALWLDTTKGINSKKGLEHLVFIIVYPNKFSKLEWDFAAEKQLHTTLFQTTLSTLPLTLAAEKQLHTTLFQTSGGITGAGTGHNQEICLLTELKDVLNTCDKYTHAMIISAGMIFDMVTYPTAIQRFYDWSETDEFCKAHIITKPNKPAFLHHQHIELNLVQWRKNSRPDIQDRWNDFERADDNFHDDYTPSWLKVKGLPTITNFTQADRRGKAWSYGHMIDRREIQNKNWGIINSKQTDWRKNVDKSSSYFDLMFKRMHELFYAENTEVVGKLPDKKFDLILTPTAGYSGEYFVEHLDFDGEIVFYDYSSKNVEIKQNIVEMNMSIDEIKLYSKNTYHIISFNEYGSKNNIDELKRRTNTFGTNEELRAIQNKMYNTYDIEYKIWDVISGVNTEKDWFINKIKGKRVFMNISNIYGYHISHACYTLQYLRDSLNSLIDILKSNTEYYHLRGTDVSKRSIK